MGEEIWAIITSIFSWLVLYAEGLKAGGILFGGVGGVATYFWRTKLEQREREQKVFDQLEEKYYEWNKLLLRYPGLDVGWFRDDPEVVLTPDQQLQQNVLYEILTRHFEHLYLTFVDTTDDQRKFQWRGWDAYIEDYCRKRSYQRWWTRDDWPLRSMAEGDLSQYDKRFETFMAEKLRSQMTKHVGRASVEAAIEAMTTKPRL